MAFGEVMMRLEVPEQLLLSQGHTLNYTFSGTGVNVAAAMVALGHKSSVVTAIPSNPVGDAALVQLRKFGIQTDFIIRQGKHIGIYFLENGFGLRPGRITYAGRPTSSYNEAKREDYYFEEIADWADIVHFCGISLAMNEDVRTSVTSLAKEVKAAGGKVVFDCNYRPGLWGDAGYEKARPYYEEMLQLSDIVMMNEKDALFLLGMSSDKADRLEQLEELIPKVAENYGLLTIAGTQRTIYEANRQQLLGYIYRQDCFSFSESDVFAVLDRIGAGDAFTCGILHGELNGWESQETVEFATAAAMLAHTIRGDTPLATETEIKQLMLGQPQDVKR